MERTARVERIMRDTEKNKRREGGPSLPLPRDSPTAHLFEVLNFRGLVLYLRLLLQHGLQPAKLLAHPAHISDRHLSFGHALHNLFVATICGRRVQRMVFGFSRLHRRSEDAEVCVDHAKTKCRAKLMKRPSTPQR